MRLLFFISAALIMSSCASFPILSIQNLASCADKKSHNRPNFSVIFKQSESYTPYDKNKKYVEMNSQYLEKTGCFVIEKTSENNKITFEFTNRIVDVEYRIPPFFSFITLGILPTWAKIITDLRVIKSDSNHPEVEVFSINYEKYSIVSIFLAPVGVYRSIVAPKGLNANEAAQLETNQYLINEAVIEIKKKGQL